MKTIAITAFFILSAICSFAQSLGANRVAKIKDCVVRVTIDSGGSMGTGFVIDNAGTVVTCWHVIAPFLIFNQNNQITGYRKIVIEFNDGTKLEYGVPLVLLEKASSGLLGYDVCIIQPNIRFTTPTKFLKIGLFSNLNEGDDVVTCGYPFGIPRQFISKGIVSTKYQDSVSVPLQNGHVNKISVKYSLIDITMNKGNSGGPIIKIGSNPNEDEVVGVADFIITPVGKDVTQLVGDLSNSTKNGSVSIMGINTNESMAKIGQVLTNMSNGISGFVSTDHIQDLINLAR